MTSGQIRFFDTPTGAVPFSQIAVQLHPADDVGIAKTPISSGVVLKRQNAPDVAINQFIPSGHKFALKAAAVGDPIRRYGQIIGFATQPIGIGDHVHTHNLAVEDFARDYAFCTEVRPVEYVPEDQRRTFLGYRRADGRVGTRNYIALLASVNCSAHTIREIARYFTPERLAAYPNVDGVIALTHGSGCGIRTGGEDYDILQRTIVGMARHANVGGYIMIGLGCETNQIQDIMDNYHLNGASSDLPLNLTIQSQAGFARRCRPESNWSKACCRRSTRRRARRSRSPNWWSRSSAAAAMAGRA